MTKRPHILLILNDDMGYSDLGCYGGEVNTPNLDRLAEEGLRFTEFYNTARCCPSRASLLTGLHPHQTGVGHMMIDDGIDGYVGDLVGDCATIPEVLKQAGYATYMSGKWHVSRHAAPDDPQDNWPCQRGFDQFYGILAGAADFFQPPHLYSNNNHLGAPKDKDYFFTDDISDHACEMLREHDGNNPFFMYLAYTAPHWPLHAPEEDIAAYAGRFNAGWDHLRNERLGRMKQMGLLEDHWELSPRDAGVGPWSEQDHKDWECRRMEVYAAQIDIMDRGIGRVIETLRTNGELDNTLIMFLADNGGCAEQLPVGGKRFRGRSICDQTRDGKEIKVGNSPDIWPGGPDTFCSYGVPWANVSNTPFRYYKHWVHEGGIATPLIVRWGDGITDRGSYRRQPHQLPDIMATICEITQARYPSELAGRNVLPCEGFSMANAFADANARPSRETLYWEHEGNQAVRRGQWKLVKRHQEPWELFDMAADRSECHNLAADKPELVAELSAAYDAWAQRCQVQPYENICARRQQRT